MVQNCCAVGCFNKAKKGNTLSFHAFPWREPKRFAKWISRIRRESTDGEPWHPTKNDRVCGAHFTDRDYYRGLQQRTLREDAVPSVFPNNPAYKQPASTSRRRSPKKRKFAPQIPVAVNENETIETLPEGDHNYAHPSIESHLEKTQCKLRKLEERVRCKAVKLKNVSHTWIEAEVAGMSDTSAVQEIVDTSAVLQIADTCTAPQTHVAGSSARLQIAGASALPQVADTSAVPQTVDTSAKLQVADASAVPQIADTGHSVMLQKPDNTNAVPQAQAHGNGKALDDSFEAVLPECSIFFYGEEASMTDTVKKDVEGKKLSLVTASPENSNEHRDQPWCRNGRKLQEKHDSNTVTRGEYLLPHGINKIWGHLLATDHDTLQSDYTGERTGGSLQQSQSCFLPITCGYLGGTLHTNKFYCPGFTIQCIQYYGFLITPAEFLDLAGFAQHNKWKDFIVVKNEGCLRQLMETGQVRFRDHHLFCSMQCQDIPHERPDISPGSLVGETETVDELEEEEDEVEKNGDEPLEEPIIENDIAMENTGDNSETGGSGGTIHVLDASRVTDFSSDVTETKEEIKPIIEESCDSASSTHSKGNLLQLIHHESPALLDVMEIKKEIDSEFDEVSAGKVHSVELHNNNVNELCRACGGRVRSSLEKSRNRSKQSCHTVKKELLLYFNIGIEGDIEGCHSSFVCFKCMKKMNNMKKRSGYRAIQAARDLAEKSRTLWTQYNPSLSLSACSVCGLHAQQSLGSVNKSTTLQTSSEKTDTCTSHIPLSADHVLTSERTDTCTSHISPSADHVLTSERTDTCTSHTSPSAVHVLASERTDTCTSHTSPSADHVLTSERTDTCTSHTSPSAVHVLASERTDTCTSHTSPSADHVLTSERTGTCTSHTALSADHVLTSERTGTCTSHTSLSADHILTSERTDTCTSNTALSADRVLTSETTDICTSQTALSADHVLTSETTDTCTSHSALSADHVLTSERTGT